MTVGFRARRAAELRSVNGKCLDFECSMSGDQVQASVAASDGPRKGPAVLPPIPVIRC